MVANNEATAILGLCALAQENIRTKTCDLDNEVDLEAHISTITSLGDEDSSCSSDGAYSTISSRDSEEDNNLSDDDLEIEQISEIKSENRISSVLED